MRVCQVVLEDQEDQLAQLNPEDPLNLQVLLFPWALGALVVQEVLVVRPYRGALLARDHLLLLEEQIDLQNLLNPWHPSFPVVQLHPLVLLLQVVQRHLFLLLVQLPQVDLCLLYHPFALSDRLVLGNPYLPWGPLDLVDLNDNSRLISFWFSFIIILFFYCF